jgi:N-acetylated-alpha-linked acidic dipeptidase
MDPGFVFGKSQAGGIGMALLRMLDAPLLPFSFSDAARTYGEYVDEIEELAAKELGEDRLDLRAVRSAVNRLAAAGEAFDAAAEVVTNRGSRWMDGKRDELQSVNREIFLAERDLGNPEGLPRREWFRHSIYAPGFYTGYGVKTMPGIREAVEQGDLTEAAQQAVMVTNAINRMAARVEHITQELSGL